MSAEQLHTFSIASYIVSGVLLVLCVVLFFAFNVPTLINNLRGYDERRFKKQAKDEKSAAKKSKTQKKDAAAAENKAQTVLEKQEESQMTTALENENRETTVLEPKKEYAATTALYQKEQPKAAANAIPGNFEVIEEFCYTSSNEIIE
jgi:Sec-independent protein translocase protein TatA